MNVIECLKNNDMIFPDYKKVSIIDVMRTIYKYCGYQYKVESINKEVEQFLKNKKHILFILADGMGSNLIDSLSDKMMLKKNKVADILTVCPTATGCVLSSVATAEYPAIHGMIGWYNHNRDIDIDYYTLLFKDRHSGKNLEELGIKEKDIYVCESIMNKLKRKTIALFPEKIVNSNFSKFVLNKNRIAYNSIQEAFKKATDNIKKDLDIETFTYLYLPYIDSESHYNGVYSKEVKKVINEIEKELIKLKSQEIRDLEIVIIADHGQIDVTYQDIIMDFEKYNKYFYALPGIDFGTATYYVKNDKKEEFLDEFQKDYKNRMYIFETDEFIKNNIFGKDKVSQYMKSNLGEYISFCKKGAYFVNTITDTERYIGKIKGSHSGFSKEELTIPLIVIDM
ncbi:MAG: alkaline phosphatase family protein [Clostridia bacterium]|nr:alkaline phosphatase family protein [Clostridia bacterium]